MELLELGLFKAKLYFSVMFYNFHLSAIFFLKNSIFGTASGQLKLYSPMNSITYAEALTNLKSSSGRLSFKHQMSWTLYLVLTRKARVLYSIYNPVNFSLNSKDKWLKCFLKIEVLIKYYCNNYYKQWFFKRKHQLLC